MTYRGQLAGTGYIFAAVHSSTAGELAVVSSEINGSTVDSSHVDLYSNQNFAVRDVIELPDLTSGNTSYVSEGMFGAYRSNGSVLYVLTRSTIGTASTWVLYGIQR